MGNGIHGLHWVRYGIAGDQQYLLGEFAETYDQLVVNANMLAHMPAAMSAFLSQKAKKPFVIDPQTHAFQHEVEHLISTSKKSAGELKRSWRGLVERYGEPLTTIFGADAPRPLSPADLGDKKLLRAFCARVLGFQQEMVTASIESGPDSKYLKFLAKKKGGARKYPPEMVIAPYFYVGGPAAEEWFDLNIRCLAAARFVKADDEASLPLAAELVISKEVLADKDFVGKMAKGYASEKPDVLLLWIDNFVEQAATKYQLNQFCWLIEQLGEAGIPVVNLYGGFFSVAQARGGRLDGNLMGVCHGLEYGESKPVVPMSGGVPVAKFYSNSLHFRLPPRVAYQEIEAREALDSATRYQKLICSCPECRKHVVKKPRNEFVSAYGQTVAKAVWRSGQFIPMQFPTAEASDHCTRHYMWCKGAEYSDSYVHTDVKAALLNAHDSLKTHLGGDYVSHAQAWAELL